MPRKARKLPQSAATGQAYGVAQDQRDAQKIIPLPDRREGAPPSAAAPPTPTATAPQAPMDPLQAALEMAPPPPGGLLAESGRPDEPVTAGLSSGPGPGPDAIRMPMMQDPAAVWRQLAETTGNPLFLRMAEWGGFR